MGSVKILDRHQHPVGSRPAPNRARSWKAYHLPYRQFLAAL